MIRKVTLAGHGEFWFQEENGEGPLAPLDHCGDDGTLVPTFPVPDSYAHVFANGDIMRYRKIIGHVTDLKEAT